jgi:MerR family transcriptional regulator/heat shock protein HspR
MTSVRRIAEIASGSEGPPGDQPCYIISVAARLVGLHPQTLRYYESQGLIKPRRSPGNKRLYSPRDIERLRQIQRLTTELGVNLAGVEAILHLAEEMAKLEAELALMEERLAKEVALLKSKLENAD